MDRFQSIGCWIHWDENTPFSRSYSENAAIRVPKQLEHTSIVSLFWSNLYFPLCELLTSAMNTLYLQRWFRNESMIYHEWYQCKMMVDDDTVASFESKLNMELKDGGLYI